MNYLRLPITFIKRAAVAVCLLAAPFLTAPASAQLDGASLAELARHDYLHRDMVLFSQGLGLDDFQRLILDSLFEDYFDRFNAGWEQTQERIHNMATEVQGSDHDRILDMVMAPFDEWRAEKQRLRQRFESDVKAILNPEQAQSWPKFYRQMVREKTLPWGRLAGESVNLFHHVRNLRLNEQALLDLEPVMDQYAEELHDALEQRNSQMSGFQAETIRSLRRHGSMPTTDPGQEVQNRVQIRDINLRYIEVLVDRLPSNHAATFVTNVMEEVNPRVYRTLTAYRAIVRATELEDLDEDTREAILGIKARFESELEPINQRLHVMTLDFEPKQLRNQAEMLAARQRGEAFNRIEDPVRPALNERNEWAQALLAQVHELLTPEQIRRLPGGARAGTPAPDASRRTAGGESRGALRGSNLGDQSRGTPRQDSDTPRSRTREAPGRSVPDGSRGDR